MVAARCAGCAKTIKGSDAYAGRTILCPNCKQAVTFPAAVATAATPVSPPPSPPRTVVSTPRTVSHEPPSTGVPIQPVATPLLASNRLLILIAAIGGGIVVLLLVVVVLLLRRTTPENPRPPVGDTSPVRLTTTPSNTQEPASNPKDAVPVKTPSGSSTVRTEEEPVAAKPQPAWSVKPLPSASLTSRLYGKAEGRGLSLLRPPAGQCWVVVQFSRPVTDVAGLKSSRLLLEGKPDIHPSYAGVYMSTGFPNNAPEPLRTSFVDMEGTLDQPVTCLAFAIPAGVSGGVWMPAEGTSGEGTKLTWSSRPGMMPPQMHPWNTTGSVPRPGTSDPAQQEQLSELKARSISAPAVIQEVVGLGAGSELVCRLVPGTRLSIFDPQAATFGNEIEIPTDALAACGGDRVVVYAPGSDTFTAYDLKTGRSVSTYANSLGGKPLCLAMGQSVGDRFFVCWQLPEWKAKAASNAAAIASTADGALLVSLDSGREENATEYHWTSRAWVRAAYDLSAVVSTLGSSFTRAGTRLLGPGEGGLWTLQKLTEGRGPRTPYPNGTLLDYGGLVKFGESTSAIQFPALQLFPVQGFDLMLGLDYRSGMLTMHELGQAEPLFSFGAIPGVRTTGFRGYSSSFKADADRICAYDPVNGHLIVVLPDRQSLLYTKQSLSECARSAGKPILGIRTEMVPLAVRGEAWSHELNVVSSPATPSFRLAKAPEGMSIDPKGRVTWQVPAKLNAMDSVIVEVSCQGLTRRHTLLLLPARREGKALIPVERLPGLAANQEYLPLKGQVVRTAIAGEGRYAVCAVLEAQQLVVVDLLESREVATIPWEAGEKPFPFAAGGDRVVVYARTSNVLRCYDLKTGRSEGQCRNPLPSPISDLVMGWKSGDAVFCAATEEQGKSVMDVLRLPAGSRLNVTIPVSHWNEGYNVRLQAGADLSVITMFRNRVSPSGAIVMRRTGNTYSSKYEHRSWGMLYPMEGDELAGDRYTYDMDLKQRLDYWSAGNGTAPALRPVVGAPMLLGIRDKEVFLYARGRNEPLRVWATLPHYSTFRFDKALQPFYRKISEHAFFNAELGRGFLIPVGRPGLVVVVTKGGQEGPLIVAPPVISLPATLNVMAGKAFTHRAQVLTPAEDLSWTLVRGPEGLTLSPEGELRWSVPDTFRTPVEIELAVKGKDGIDKRTVKLVPTSCELSDPTTWQAGNGLLLLGSESVAGSEAGGRYAVVARGAELFCIDAESLQPSKKTEAPGPVKFLGVRGSEALVLTDRQLVIFSLPDLRQIKCIALPCDEVTDLAWHASTRLSWVAGRDPTGPDDFRNRRILQVNESTGKAQWLPGVLGRYVAVSPDGRKLVAAIQETLVDSATLVDMWGQAYHFTATGCVDLLVRYALSGTTAKPEEMHKQPGANLKRVVISPDGKHVSPVAGGGYRAGGFQGYAIPAFQMNDFGTCDALYETSAYPAHVVYHPSLDVVVAGNEKNVFVFDRRKGTAKSGNLADALGLTEVARVFFGRNASRVCLLGKHKEHGWILASVDLSLDGNEPRIADAPRPKVITDAPAANDRPGPAAPPEPIKAALAVTRRQLDVLVSPANLRAMTPRDVAATYQNAIVLISHARGTGSGFMIGAEGWIATCAHVLPPRDGLIQVTMHNPKTKSPVTLKAEVVARDDARDLALLKVTPGFTATFVRFENRRKPEMGEEVSIIGNPGLGDAVLSNTMTQGIVSNPKREIDGMDFIQTSAAVNPGTSGGPVFNGSGNVIGVVTLKGNIEAVGFAVPVDALLQFLESCCTDGQKNRPVPRR